MGAVIQGFGLGFGLILAIGAQNAFVLRQGLRRAHVLAVVLCCAISDAILIVFGITSFGWVSSVLPWITPAMRFGGAAFLAYYGYRNAVSAWRGGEALDASEAKSDGLYAAMLTCLALTWLNPHVYLDTVVLLGSISAQYDPVWPFGLGAIIASFTFFFSLGFGARLLAPFFAKPEAWRVLDALIAATMWAIAASLVFNH